MVIIQPKLTQTLFGGDSHVTLPSKIHEEKTFVAHGKTWRVKKISRREYMLTCPLETPRARFGLAAEIAEDIGRVFETGQLPQSKQSIH